MANVNIGQQETVIRATVSGELRENVAGRQAEHGGRVAKKMREQFANQDPVMTLEKFKEMKIDESKAAEHINSSIGTRNTENGEIDRTEKETQRFNAANKAERTARNIIQKDLLELSPAELDVLRNAAIDALRQLPGANKFIDECFENPAELDNFIMNAVVSLTEDGTLKTAIAKKYNEVFSKERPSGSDKEKEARAKINEINTQLTAIDSDIKNNDHEHTYAVEELERDWREGTPGEPLTGEVEGPFVPTGPKRAVLNAEQEKVNDFIKNLESLKKDKDGNQIPYTEEDVKSMIVTRDVDSQAVARLKEKRDALLAQMKVKKPAPPASIHTDLKDAETAYENAAGELENNNRIISRYQEISKKRDVLLQQLDSAQDKVSSLLERGNQLKQQKDRLKEELSLAKVDLDEISIEGDGYVKSIEDIVKDALSELYESRYEEAMKISEKQYEEMIEAELDPVVKNLLKEARLGRWRQIKESKLSKLPLINKFKRSRNLGKGEVEVFSLDQIKMDINAIRASYEQGNIDEAKTIVIRQMLQSQGLTDERIKEYLEEGGIPEEKILAVNKRLVALGMRNNVLKPSDMEMIQDVMGENFIKEAIEANKEYFEEAKKRAGFAGSTVEFIKKHPRVGWFLLFTAMFPGLGLAALGGYAGFRVVKEVMGGGKQGGEHGEGGGHAKKEEQDHE